MESAHTDDILMEEIESLQEQIDALDGHYKSFASFKESCRRAHSEPRCKDYSIVEAERWGKILESSENYIEWLWQEEYKRYLKAQLDVAEWKDENPLVTGMMRSVLDKGAAAMMKKSSFQKFSGESHDFNTNDRDNRSE